VQSTFDDPVELAVIDGFLRQFMLAQLVVQLLIQLANAGHFGFQTTEQQSYLLQEATGALGSTTARFSCLATILWLEGASVGSHVCFCLVA
jgi:hypothetical protein